MTVDFVFTILGYKNAQAEAFVKYREKERQQKFKQQLKQGDEVTYEYNPRLKEAEKLFKNDRKS